MSREVPTARTQSIPAAGDDPFADRFASSDEQPSGEAEPLAETEGVAPAAGDAWQVSLVGLLWLVTLAGALFGAWPLLEPPAYAGAMGGLVLVALAVHSWLRIEAAWWQAAWWLLLVIYLAACGLAMWRG